MKPAWSRPRRAASTVERITTSSASTASAARCWLSRCSSSRYRTFGIWTRRCPVSFNCGLTFARPTIPDGVFANHCTCCTVSRRRIVLLHSEPRATLLRCGLGHQLRSGHLQSNWWERSASTAMSTFRSTDSLLVGIRRRLHHAALGEDPRQRRAVIAPARPGRIRPCLITGRLGGGCIERKRLQQLPLTQGALCQPRKARWVRGVRALLIPRPGLRGIGLCAKVHTAVRV